MSVLSDSISWLCIPCMDKDRHLFFSVWLIIQCFPGPSMTDGIYYLLDGGQRMSSDDIFSFVCCLLLLSSWLFFFLLTLKAFLDSFCNLVCFY